VKPELRDRLLAAGVDPDRIPRHIAIIMDGNGRWAERQGLPRLSGHYRGYETVERTVTTASDLGVEAMTLYTFSAENWRRPESEIEGIMHLIAEAAHAQLRKLLDEGVRLCVSGRIEELPDYVRDPLLLDMERTRDNPGLVLNLAINYGGRTELVDAARELARRTRDEGLDPESIDEQLFASCLYRPELPDPDLLIRTAGEKRVSNFLLWQIAYSELHVTSVMWPDFSDEDLFTAIADYQKRVRKFGGVLHSPAGDGPKHAGSAA